MGLLNRLLPFTKRHVDPLNDDRYFSDVMQLASASGMKVTPESARRCAAVIACVRVLAETVAVLPFVQYRNDNDARSREKRHQVYKLLQHAPNRWQTAFEFREMMMGHVCLRGNGYAQKIYDRRGQIIELVPLNPTRVTPKMNEKGDPFYEFRPQTGGIIEIGGDDMFHLKGYASDGLVGVSPIAEARETVALSLAAEEFGSRTFANDAQPGGVLEHPGSLGDEALENLRKSLKDQHSGVQNARKWMILEEGMKWTKVGMSPDDTQYVETRKFQIEEIARIFRVPPHLIGHLERATFSNIEHQSLEFVTHTILPWLRRWEGAIQQRLFTEQEREVYYCEFLVEGLLRGDIQTRYSSYKMGREGGWLSANDVRRFENMDPLPGDYGDKYLIPLNMIDAGRLDEYMFKDVVSTDTPLLTSDGDTTTSGTDNNTQRSFVGDAAFRPVFGSVLERYADRVRKSSKPFAEHREVIREGIDPIVAGLLLLNERDDADSLAKGVVDSFLEWWNGQERSVAELTSKVIQLSEEAVKGDLGA